LSSLATDQPVLGLVDDAHWLDQESSLALAFVARRLVAERIALVFATRDVGDSFARLPELHVTSLGHRDARALLESVLLAPLDEQVMERLIVEAGGNPLALIELPRGLTTAELAGGFGLPDARPLASRIEHSFLQRVQALPPDAQLLLLTAAAEPLGDLGLLWRAAEILGIGGQAA